ncbi:hypothetical protein A5655_14950 [Mycobacterium sp. 1081908.1]|nr:hypothetical protein A5655_14950 [Mycobacterium sp. 1081908.1]
MYRRNDPTAYRSVGPLSPVDVLAGELKPSDATDAGGGPLLMFSNDDCRILLSRRHEEMPFYTRHVDGGQRADRPICGGVVAPVHVGGPAGEPAPAQLVVLEPAEIGMKPARRPAFSQVNEGFHGRLPGSGERQKLKVTLLFVLAPHKGGLRET